MHFSQTWITISKTYYCSIHIASSQMYHNGICTITSLTRLAHYWCSTMVVCTNTSLTRLAHYWCTTMVVCTITSLTRLACTLLMYHNGGLHNHITYQACTLLQMSCCLMNALNQEIVLKHNAKFDKTIIKFCNFINQVVESES